MLQNRKQFIVDLENLNNKVVGMGKEVIIAFQNTIEACKENDIDLAKDILKHDKLINDIEISINVDAYLLIAKQCPVAGDLRGIITGLKISNDLERIADYAVNIAKYLIKTIDYNSRYLDSIIKLINHVIIMLIGIIEAFEGENIELALEISELDEILDKEYEDEVKNIIKIGNNSSETEVEEAMRALLIYKQLERAGDHITNIAENIVYLVNGRRVELN